MNGIMNFRNPETGTCVVPRHPMPVSVPDGGFRRHAAAVVTHDARGIVSGDGRRINSNPDAVPAASDSVDTGRSAANAAIGVDRSALDDWRVSLHEGGHVIVGRALGSQVGGVTIVEGPDYGGLTWGPTGNASHLSSAVDDQPDLCEKVANLMPGPGESRANAADIFAHVHVRIVDLMAGTAAEALLHPSCPPWVAHSDIRQARQLASIICTSEAAIDAYLNFAAEEAKAIVLQHRSAILAIADALMIERTLDAAQIDNIIAATTARETMRAENERRARWRATEQNAAEFSAGLN
jgi:hypothetical protein